MIFYLLHKQKAFTSLKMRIEKGERVCYIIDRKGDTDVQVIAKPGKSFREIPEGKPPGRKGMIPVYR